MIGKIISYSAVIISLLPLYLVFRNSDSNCSFIHIKSTKGILTSLKVIRISISPQEIFVRAQERYSDKIRKVSTFRKTQQQ